MISRGQTVAIADREVQPAKEYHICRVCGDRASGFHYGVFCCEGCKGFFYRTIRASKQYRFCNNPDGCLVVKSNRVFCRFCRMQRCLESGMSYESVKMGRYRKCDKTVLMLMQTKISPADKLNMALFKGYIRARQQWQEEFKKDEENYLKVDSPTAAVKLYSLYVSDVIRFATTLVQEVTLFQKLSLQTQRLLIKHCIIELSAILDLGYRVDSDQNFINHRLGCVINTQHWDQLGTIGLIIMNSFDVSTKLKELCLTPVELSLLMVLVICSSDKVETASEQQLEDIEETLLTTLKFQVVMNHNGHLDIMPKLIEIVCVLRGLTTLYLTDLLKSELRV